MNKAKPLTFDERAFLNLIMRSEDKGDGWRSVSAMLWPTVQTFAAKRSDLVETGAQKIRLTTEGVTVWRYIP